MNSHIVSLSKNKKIAFFVAAFVPAFLALIGVGIYHGTFHASANETHCHENTCHKH